MGTNVDLSHILGLPSTIECPKCRLVTQTFFGNYDIKSFSALSTSPGVWSLHVRCNNCEHEWRVEYWIPYQPKGNVMPVMTRESLDRFAFKRLLMGPEGCNFHKGDDNEIRWTCNSHENVELDPYLHSKRILERMGYDVEASIEYFYENHAYCDCEILFNIFS